MKKEKIVQNRSHVEDRVTVPELIKKKIANRKDMTYSFFHNKILKAMKINVEEKHMKIKAIRELN